ncbi:N-6 DNA methylase [Vibrio sp. 1CM23M]|uniref:HsdM family class I SAM-dependent methyltransferase n=1 Tax=Vibrio sp. 1CM23M TaxID=2929164 RepID=UPI0020BF0461|nr:N-6 DNA methylase [Vibrio sp. 1CM23M]MCK8072466.1 SAM-dependent methyltransferase [Vibrio sp. 1CM23M]
MKKLLKEITRIADSEGIRKQRAFELFVEERFDVITNIKPYTKIDGIYLDLVKQNPFEDVLEKVAVELGYLNKRMGQFMTPSSVSALLLSNSEHLEALDYSCGTGVNGLTMLAKTQAKATVKYGGSTLPMIIHHSVKPALTLHLNDLDETMAKIAFIQTLANYNVHCRNSFNLDLLVTNNHLIKDWKKPLKQVFKSYNSRQNFKSMSEAKKDLLILNPPFGLADYGFDYAKANTDEERFSKILPNKKDCESAFILSALDLMTDDGEAFLILPEGCNFTKATMAVRKQVFSEKLMDCIVSLPPKIFSETAIPTTVWNLKKKRDKDKVFLINLREEAEYFKSKKSFDILKSSFAMDFDKCDFMEVNNETLFEYFNKAA